MSSLDDFVQAKLTALESRHLRRALVTSTRHDGVIVERGGRRLVSFSCNDYLSLSSHPALAEAARTAIEKFGLGAGASRLVTGNHPLYDELEQLVPKERKESFLRLSRQLKEFGDHNPELLRIVEAMGFLSLYTEHLPQRLTASIAAARAQLTAELKALHAAQLNSLAGANDQLQKHIAALHDAGQNAQSLATQLSFPDADQIRATVESNAETAQTIANTASTMSRRLAVNRIWHLIVIAGLGILYFVGGAWFLTLLAIAGSEPSSPAPQPRTQPEREAAILSRPLADQTARPVTGRAGRAPA